MEIRSISASTEMTTELMIHSKKKNHLWTLRAVFGSNPPSTVLNREVSAHRLLLQSLQTESSGEIQAWTVETKGKFVIGSTSAVLGSDKGLKYTQP